MALNVGPARNPIAPIARVMITDWTLLSIKKEGNAAGGPILGVPTWLARYPDTSASFLRSQHTR